MGYHTYHREYHRNGSEGEWFYLSVVIVFSIQRNSMGQNIHLDPIDHYRYKKKDRVIQEQRSTELMMTGVSFFWANYSF